MRQLEVFLWLNPINEAKQLLEDMASNNYHWVGEWGQPKRRTHEIVAFTMLQARLTHFFVKGRLTSTYSFSWWSPYRGHLDKQVFVKCVEFKGIVGMNVMFVSHFKALLLNKSIPSITSIMYHKITPTPIPLIRVRDTTQTSPKKAQTPLLIIPHKIILIVPESNTAVLKFHLYNPHLKSPT